MSFRRQLIEWSIAGAWACLLAMFTASTTHAQLIRDLQRVVDNSDLIAVVQVGSVVQTRSGTISVGPQTYLAHFRVATVRSVCTLKGQLPRDDFPIPYTVLYSPGGWGGGVPRGYVTGDNLTPQAFRLVFLKKVGNQLQLTDGSYLSIVAPSEQSNCHAAGTPMSSIVMQLSAVLFSSGSIENNKRELYRKGDAVGQLSFIDDPEVVPILKRFLLEDTAKTNPWLGDDAIVGILAHKDLSVVDLVEPALLRADNTSPTLMIALTGAVPVSRSVPILAKALGVPNPIVRRNAVEALYNTNSPLAIPVLLGALDDTDSGVIFAVMQGLNFLTHQGSWGPQTKERSLCLKHWREYRTRWMGEHTLEQ
jgi:hypothetical protein